MKMIVIKLLHALYQGHSGLLARGLSYVFMTHIAFAPTRLQTRFKFPSQG